MQNELQRADYYNGEMRENGREIATQGEKQNTYMRAWIWSRYSAR